MISDFRQIVFIRYQLITLCSDESGTIPVMWSDDEVTRLTGKTVYDFLADDVQVANAGNLFILSLFRFNYFIF